MGGGGKGGTSTSTVSIPPEVLARYNAVNARAEEVAKKPFEAYTGEFVAPITQTQQAGINQTQQYANAAQPYYQAATDYTASGVNAANYGYGQAGAQTQQAVNAALPIFAQAGSQTQAAYNAAQPTYQSALGLTGSAINAAQPYYQAGAALTALAAQNAAPLTNEQIAQYQNPYVQSVVDPTLRALQQQQAIDRQSQTAQAIRAGAYGGERAALQRAVLGGQQELAQAQAISPLYQSAYQNALAAAQQQQQLRIGTGMQAGQQIAGIGGQQLSGTLQGAQQYAGIGGEQLAKALATQQQVAGIGGQALTAGLQGAQQQAGITGQQLAANLQGGQQIAGIGTGAQQAGLQGAQAVIGAGTLGQQTQQAQDTAKYQQFLQERGYDFQTAQFLANIAEGTGALSGSTTTTTQPTSFFSDERLKHDIKKIGKTNDGLPIYSFKYNGDDRTQIGLMAQDVEKKRPEAVGLAGGYKTVDYAKATAGARHARAMGGLVPESMGGAVLEPGNYARGGYVGGGLVTDPDDIKAILAAQKQSFGPFAAGGLYGGSAQQDPHGAAPGYVPKAALPVAKLVTSSFQPKQQQGGLQSAMQNINSAGTTAKNLSEGWDLAESGYKKLTGGNAPAGSPGSVGANPPANPPLPPVRPPATKEQMGFNIDENSAFAARGGGIMPRHRFADGGAEDAIQDDFTTPGTLKEEKTSGKENRANVPSSGFPTDVLSSGNAAKELAVAKNPSTSGGQSGISSLAQGLGAANSALKAGKSISTMLGGGADAIGGGGTFAAGMGPFMSEAGIGAAGAGAAEGAGILGGLGSALGTVGEAALAILPFFSDARLKDNIKHVGKTFDGQNIYSYDMGDGRTQMGLLAQEVLRHKPEAVGKDQGYLTVDYRKATEDAVPHRAMGGVVPRHGYQTDGTVTDPLAGYDPKDLAIRTIAAETSGHPEETAGIAAVIRNRLASGNYGPDYRSVVTAKNQFEPWNNPNTANYPLRIDPNSERYKQAAAALVRHETEGYDPTDGATHFWAPKAQAALGRKPPSWDNENARDIGMTRFVKVGDTAPPQLAPVQQQSYPFQTQIEGGLGKAKALADSVAPRTYQGQERSMGDFLTSKDFVIPLLTGLGTMASSPSRYLGSAILQGLGGAASAYMGVQNQQLQRDQALAETGLTKAQTGLTGAQTVQASIIDSGAGPLVAVPNPEGGYRAIRAFEYFALPVDQRAALGLSADEIQKLKVQADKEGGVGIKPPPGTTTTLPAATTTTVTPPPAPEAPQIGARAPIEPPIPNPSILTPQEKETVQRNLTAAQAANAGTDYYTKQKERADAAQNQQALLRDLATSMARLPETGSPTVAGRLSPLTVGGTEVVSNLLKILGRDPSKLGIADTTDPQEIAKIIKNIAGDRQYQGNIHAHAVLDDIAQRFPTMINTREGQAKLMASVMSLQRREIDKYDYNNALLQHANSIDPRMGSLSGRDNERLFDQRYGTLYPKEEEVLKKMFLTPMVVDGKKQVDPQTNRPISQMEYLHKFGNQLTPAELVAIENQLKAPRVLRYFGLYHD